MEIVKPLADEQVILKYNGGEVKAKEVKANVSSKIKELSEQVIEMYKKGAENAVVEKLLNEEAKKRGVPNISALLESISSAPDATDAEVAAFMKANNLQNGYKDPQTGKMRKVSKEEIKAYLSKQSKTKQTQEFIGKLTANANIVWMLKESLVPIAALTSDEPILGNPNAKVVIYEYSDFQCPFCGRVVPSLDKLFKAYPDKIRIIFKQYPLSFHANARPAAKAALAAGRQGKFWEMHDLLFANQTALSDANYLAWAKQLNLDLDQFKKDLSDPALETQIAADEKEARGFGISGTPSFVINGTKYVGAYPYERFEQIIKAELEKK
jgi:protein-disulfide isomerase